MRTPLDRHGRRRLWRTPAVTGAVLVASALLLTGCHSDPSTTTATNSSTPRASGATSVTPKATPAPTGKPTPVKLACDHVVTSDQLGKLVPVLTAIDDFTPEKGTDATTALGADGVACGFTNPSTGHTVTVSIARPAKPQLTALKNKAIDTSNVVPTYGVPPKVMGYFAVTDSVGVAEAFTGDYWVVVASKDYIEPGDASQVMADVLGNIAG